MIKKIEQSKLNNKEIKNNSTRTVKSSRKLLKKNRFPVNILRDLIKFTVEITLFLVR